MSTTDHYKYFYRHLPTRPQIKFYLTVFCTFAPIWTISVSRLSEHRRWLEVTNYFVSSGVTAVAYAFAFTRKGYILFVNFIQNEGEKSLRLQTEIDLNRVVWQTKRPEMFVTLASLGVEGDRTARFVNAGHPPILHYRHDRHDRDYEIWR